MMKKYIRCVGFLIILILTSCASSKKTNAVSSQAINKLITDQSFETEYQWAYPMLTNAFNQIANSGLLPPGSNAGQINIVGNSNYLRILKDSVSAYLPYFGERQMGGGYSRSDGAIQFEGIPKDMQITENKKGSYSINFSIEDKENNTESYQVYIQLFSNMNVSLTINSVQRSGIRYKGILMPYKKSE